MGSCSSISGSNDIQTAVFNDEPCQFIINYKSSVREFCSMRKTVRIGVQINLKRPETREREMHILN